VVTADDGTPFAFHCTRLADGSREIEIGVPVEFVVIPGGLGRWEAGVITRR
jgi:hypothetical protein